MKDFPSHLLILVALMIGFASCKDAVVESKSEIPELLTRSEKIQMGKEWEMTQNQYQNRKLKIENDSKNVLPYIELAQIFIKEARITGEHGHYYPSALKVIEKALEIPEISTDDQFLALVTKAGVELSLHEFTDALETGMAAYKINPRNAQINGVLVDAYVELGDYKKAVAYADNMVSIKPDLRSYSRISYLREIHGDVDGAIEALSLAIKAGLPGTEETAWAMQTLGELYLSYDKVDEAESIFKQILETRADYPFAVAALGDVAYARGDKSAASVKYQEAMDIIPEVGYYVSMAQIYKDAGRNSDFESIMSEIWEMLEDDVVHGHNMNMEYAHIHLDILGDPQTAQEYIDKEYAKRPKNIDVNRMMAKIMLAQNKAEETKKYAQVAASTDSQHPELIEIQEALNI